MIYFPFAEYWSFYACFTGFVLFMLALDLGVFHRNSHEVKFKEALAWSVVWVGLALTFNAFFYQYALTKLSQLPGMLPAEAEAKAAQFGLEFLTGYVVEKSLAIDNIFVFVVVFTFFAIPAKYQHRVLFYGIIGALVFRAIFIALGSVLMQYEWVVMLFGALLILTGIKMFFAPDKKVDPDKNIIIKGLRKIVPITSQHHGKSFWVRENGKLFATPLFVALVFLELSDIIFAVDSVPAIFAITKEPLIVFTSNMFAILGLRSMYFMLAGVIDKFVYLKYGLACVLIFVGSKMVYLNELYGGKFPIGLSLGIISGFISISIFVSLFKQRKAIAQ